MKKLILATFFLTGTYAFAEDAPKALLPEKHFDFLEKYCLDCHDDATE